MTEVLGTLKGGHAAAERAAKEKAEREAKRSASYSNWQYFSLKAAETGEVYGESAILRLVTDEPDWESAKQHSYIPTKPAPRDLPEGRKWPARQGAVCRYTIVPKRAANGETVYAEWYDECYIDDHVKLPGKQGKGDYSPKGSPRSWAWAVEREEYTNDEGDVAYRDILIDHVDKDGNTEKIQKFVLLNFAMENFFDQFLGYNNVYKTVVDRDYKVTRKGSGTDTSYEIIALDPQFEEVDGKSVKVDLRKEPFASRYVPPVTIFSVIEKQASDEHYEWFFDTRVESSYEARFPKKDKAEGASPDAADSDDSEVGEDHKATLAAMRQRLKDSKATANA